MTRTITKSMAGILEELELENETFVDINRLEELAAKYNVRSETSLIASRLRKAGWLLPTSQRGVWEFSPAARAGSYSKNDPLMDVKVFRIANPSTDCYLCMQTAAWALGLADRIPERKELAFSNVPQNVPDEIAAYKYKPTLAPSLARGVPCLAPESIVVQVAAKPIAFRSWESAAEWIPDVVYEIEIERLLMELSDKTDSVIRRTGYLLQGMYPAAAEAVKSITTGSSKIRFGPRTRALRNDENWMISDTILPFSPKEMERVK